MDERNSLDQLPSTINFSAVVCVDGTLSYVGQDCQRIPESLVQLYANSTSSLDLSYNRLSSLSGLEHFTALQTLVLDNNELPDSVRLPRLPHLHTLSLNNNQLHELERLLHQVASAAPALRHLSLLGNPACPDQLSDHDKDEADYRRYRYYVVHWLPNLQFLDSTPVSVAEQAEAVRRGAFMKVVRPAAAPWSSPVEVAQHSVLETAIGYSPLPQTQRSAENHQGAYGKCRFRYSGKHSEGNRFIQNQDL